MKQRQLIPFNFKSKIFYLKAGQILQPGSKAQVTEFSYVETFSLFLGENLTTNVLWKQFCVNAVNSCYFTVSLQSNSLLIFKQQIKCWNGDKCNCTLSKGYLRKFCYNRIDVLHLSSNMNHLVWTVRLCK